MPRSDPFIRRLFTFVEGRSRLVTAVELRAAGFKPSTVHDYRDRGLVTQALFGIDVVGEPALSQRELHVLGLLRGGRSSWLALRTSAEVRSVLAERFGHVDVTRVGTGSNAIIRTEVPMLDGAAGLISLRNVTVEPPTELVDGLRVASLATTFTDLARGTAEFFEPAWKEAAFKNLIEADVFERELRGSRRKGATRVRRELALRAGRLESAVDLRTKLEDAFFELVGELGLPRPECNVPMILNGRLFRPDFLYREIGLAFEVDGPHHMEPERVEADKARDVDMFVAEIDVVRFTDRAIYARTPETKGLVDAAYARQLRRSRSAAAAGR